METDSYDFYFESISEKLQYMIFRSHTVLLIQYYLDNAAPYSLWNPLFSCDFETSTQGGNIYSMKGAYLSHSATSKLVLNIKRLGEPLVQISTASNKKAANAQCALKMVGELYRRNLIERFGEEKIQKPASPPLIGGENESIGEKRKIEGAEEPVEFDENGNWTLELARSRLSEFYQKQEKQLNCDERKSVEKYPRNIYLSIKIIRDNLAYRFFRYYKYIQLQGGI